LRGNSWLALGVALLLAALAGFEALEMAPSARFKDGN